MLRYLCALMILLGSSLPAWAGEPKGAPAGTETVRLGVTRDLFHSLPPAKAQAGAKAFQGLVQARTGWAVEVVLADDFAALALALKEDVVHVGLFLGHELAWARARHAELEPLALIERSCPDRACLLVPRDAPAARFADLRGKSLALPTQGRPHCRVYLERCCRQNGLAATEFFAKVVTPPNAEDALDDLVDGSVDAVVTDAHTLDQYRERKPGRFARLRPLERSEVFPPAALVYIPSNRSANELRRLRASVLQAGKEANAQRWLTGSGVLGFGPVGADYSEALDEISKRYPPPKSDGSR